MSLLKKYETLFRLHLRLKIVKKTPHILQDRTIPTFPSGHWLQGIPQNVRDSSHSPKTTPPFPFKSLRPLPNHPSLVIGPVGDIHHSALDRTHSQLDHHV